MGFLVVIQVSLLLGSFGNHGLTCSRVLLRIPVLRSYNFFGRADRFFEGGNLGQAGQKLGQQDNWTFKSGQAGQSTRTTGRKNWAICSYERTVKAVDICFSCWTGTSDRQDKRQDNFLRTSGQVFRGKQPRTGRTRNPDKRTAGQPDRTFGHSNSDQQDGQVGQMGRRRFGQ